MYSLLIWLFSLQMDELEGGRLMRLWPQCTQNGNSKPGFVPMFRSPFTFHLEEVGHFLAPELSPCAQQHLAIFLEISHISDELLNIEGPSKGVIVERSNFFNNMPTIHQVISKMMEDRQKEW
mmetsp:Transcript_13030/g.27696  ORF Transcript_13030/g.27696 Transcript_13030/m.27696 type:complete len:122 (-) Transcript_13030:267-632(-)